MRVYFSVCCRESLKAKAAKKKIPGYNSFLKCLCLIKTRSDKGLLKAIGENELKFRYAIK